MREKNDHAKLFVFNEFSNTYWRRLPFVAQENYFIKTGINTHGKGLIE